MLFRKHQLMVGLIAGLILLSCQDKTSPGAGDDPAKGSKSLTAESRKLTAAGAFAQAEKEARAWNSGALLLEILSGPDIDASGTSSYWEFHFADPELQRKFVVVIQDQKLKETQEARQAAKLTPLPSRWMDSPEAYQKSVAEFTSRHQDQASFQRDWLTCDSRNHPNPHWTMLFHQPQHLPIGSMIDAETGAYLGEIKR